MPEITSNDDVTQMGIYAGIAAGGTALGLAYGADVFSPVYKKDKKAAAAATKAKNQKDQAVADAVATNEAKKTQEARKTIKLAEPTDEQKAIWREHNEGINNQRKAEEAQRDQRRQAEIETNNAEAARIEEHNRKLLEKQKHEAWYGGLDNESKGWVDSGLAQNQKDIDYIRNSTPETRQLMQDAHWYQQNGENARIHNQNMMNGNKPGKKRIGQRILQAVSKVL